VEKIDLPKKATDEDFRKLFYFLTKILWKITRERDSF
jgi:hypothetical protein